MTATKDDEASPAPKVKGKKKQAEGDVDERSGGGVSQEDDIETGLGGGKFADPGKKEVEEELREVKEDLKKVKEDLEEVKEGLKKKIEEEMKRFKEELNGVEDGLKKDKGEDDGDGENGENGGTSSSG